VKITKFDPNYPWKLGDTTMAQGGGVSVDTGNSGSTGGGVTLVFSTTDGVTTVDPTIELTFLDATLTDLGGGNAEIALSPISVTDGSTTVNPASEIDFTSGATVTDGGGGVAQVAITGGGGGGITHSDIGYNAAGGSWETIGSLGTPPLTIFKQVTLGTAGLIASVSAYLQMTGFNVGAMAVAVFADNAGSPDSLIAGVYPSGGASGNTWFAFVPSTPRWMTMPIGLWVPAGTYWIAVHFRDTGGGTLQIAYDGSGSDVYQHVGFVGLADGSGYTLTVGSRKYSIRADLLS
jgi:hypothetical protein